jgi:hypothetical protein
VRLWNIFGVKAFTRRQSSLQQCYIKAMTRQSEGHFKASYINRYCCIKYLGPLALPDRKRRLNLVYNLLARAGGVALIPNVALPKSTFLFRPYMTLFVLVRRKTN